MTDKRFNRSGSPILPRCMAAAIVIASTVAGAIKWLLTTDNTEWDFTHRCQTCGKAVDTHCHECEDAQKAGHDWDD